MYNGILKTLKLPVWMFVLPVFPRTIVLTCETCDGIIIDMENNCSLTSTAERNEPLIDTATDSYITRYIETNC